jgi:hypothetical protein
MGLPPMMTPPFFPGYPQAQTPAPTPQPKWLSGLNSPLGQIGLQLLANSRRPDGRATPLGQAVGNSVLGYQQQMQSGQDEQLRRRYMEAQIARMQQPEQDNAAPLIVMGPDGKPRYVSRSDAIGQQPYQPPAGNANGPGEVEIARFLNDPNTPDAVKKDLRDLLGRKYPGPSAQEPLVAVQTADGRSVLVPRSQAVGATPAATRENPQEGERTSANYYGRMEAAEGLLGDYVPSTMDYIAADRMMKGGPISGSLANAALSSKGQQYYQAAADWVRAKLRKESGAVISPEEMAQEIKTYFPLPSDSKETIAQKKRARQQAMGGMKEMGGRAVRTPTNQASPDDPLGIR